MEKEDNVRGYLKAAADDASQVEGEIQEEWNLIARDIYAFYPFFGLASPTCVMHLISFIN